MKRRSTRTSKTIASIKMQLDKEADDDDTDPMEVDESSSSSSEDDGNDKVVAKSSRRRGRAATAVDTTTTTTTTKTEDSSKTNNNRRSSRSTKCRHSMKEPSGESVRDLFMGVAYKYSSDDDDDDEAPISAMMKAKSPARRHSKHRKSLSQESADEESEVEEEEEEEEMKIQRILAARTETKQQWKAITQKMNTSEVTGGSRWFQDTGEDDNDTLQIEERFLVKWSGLSYLHVSWETQEDLLDQVDSAKTYLSTFFRKSQNGVLFGQDERKDGDYFDPGLIQIDRICEIVHEDASYKLPTNWEQEQSTKPTDFGICMDRKSDDFEDGTGRQILVKWMSANYSNCTYEFERDLLLQEIDYKQHLKVFYDRTNKLSKSNFKKAKDMADTARRKSYKLFGDQTDVPEATRNKLVQNYQQALAEHVYPNGGSLRDYQAEGVAWFLSNYINHRSCIMADEMGLGKTLQTAAFIHLLVQKMYQPGPFLIVVPLSTIAHWQREFMGWTQLNTIVYHGSAEDRTTIRELEFAYPQDRPDYVGSNALYLNKCIGHKTNQWMTTVVVTTPEMLVADDWAELAAVKWEVLVVDEAHRLKNHNSKLAINLRKEQFHFRHKLLLTGTPIQNDVKEFWTLLNFIDPDNFNDQDDFLEEFGEIKSKDRIDKLHETIRPYILRRLKEDVEKSVPPKEETLIEVELTVLQKQYYRALYEKNVKFLHKNKKKALDGPSLNNLAMQLRKCCNHLFLLNGVEEEIRDQHSSSDAITEADFLSKGSGKFVLLDKLLPRLQQDGHRILLFSQFKIMLDILEDYLTTRSMKFERIDGSITGPKRQQAIDRFQDASNKNPPFVMLLSTRAGGVGINLTSADTCIIFDSDWNPQNDLQAQARCHRIGQTKSVKVYRLLSRKTYEMQMFHMSSMKMGLDQAVLKGFESSDHEKAMTKEEVEKLLRHGAYDIFNEDKAGTAEAESNDFVEQDIDSILERRSRTVIHDNTGSQSGAAGGTFSKASFSVAGSKSPGAPLKENIDIEDPEFWTKMVGEAKEEVRSELKPRKRNRLNYSERLYEQQLGDAMSDSSGDEADSSNSSESDADESNQIERARWGGKASNHWDRNQARDLLEFIERHGYGVLEWEDFLKKMPVSCRQFAQADIRRMSWALVLLGFAEVARDNASQAVKWLFRNAEKKLLKGDEQQQEAGKSEQGGVLAASSQKPFKVTSADKEETTRTAFKKLWSSNYRWVKLALADAVEYAKANEARSLLVFDSPSTHQKEDENDECTKLFYKSVWPSLSGRGWKEESNADNRSKTYTFGDEHKFSSPSSVLNEVVRIHPELANMVIPILNTLEQSRISKNRKDVEDRAKHISLSPETLNLETLNEFLKRYAPLQLLSERKSSNRITIGRRVLTSCYYKHAAFCLFKKAVESAAKNSTNTNGEAGAVPSSQEIDAALSNILAIEPRAARPHYEWTLQHDVTLIRAIAKHGWIDREKSCRAITEDSKIKWGHPFEFTESTEQDSRKSLPPQELENLTSTANRAASFLENHSEVLEVLKGCNRHLIIESYGLKHNISEDNQLEWKMDNDLLLEAPTNLNTASSTKETSSVPSEPVDLPVKKDLTKRAKTVIQKSITILDLGVQPGGTLRKQAAATAASKQSASEASAVEVIDHNYTKIDQGDRCCILLAEMVRGIVKGSYQKNGKPMRLLFSLAYEEACVLENLFDGTKAEEMKRIASHIAESKKSMKVAAIPSKNILRVMLGLEPNNVRSSNGNETSLFPTALSDIKPSSFSKGSVKREPFRREDGALGERAITRAMKKALDKSNGTRIPIAKEADNDVGLQLTMIEVLILFTFCSEGIPVIHGDDIVPNSMIKEEEPTLTTWGSIASILDITVKDALQRATEKSRKCRAMLQKLESGADVDHDSKDKAIKQVSIAEVEEAMKEEAARHALDFQLHPAKLAKKSIMLLEKVRKQGFSDYSSKSKNPRKVEDGLGLKVQAWFGKELSRLAQDFEVADSYGGTMTFTTSDLLREKKIADTPNAEDAAVAAYFDKSNCRKVVSQISMLAKIQKIFSTHPLEKVKDKVNAAVSKSKKIEERWDKRPKWWDDSGHHNFLLLKRLNENGFTNFHSDTSGFGLEDPDQDQSVKRTLKELGLTKSIIQQRANQLCREIHAEDEQKETKKLLEDRRKRSKKHSFDKSLVECHPSSNKKKEGGNNKKTSASNNDSSSKKSAKKTLQTGLHAFFTATKTNSRKETVIILSDDDDESKYTGKRKSSSSEEDFSAEKKAKKNVRPSVKAGTAGTPGSPSRPRCLVNKNGEIEVANVPEC